MGIFSLFFNDKKSTLETSNQTKDFSAALGAPFYKEIADSHAHMMLYYLQGEGFVGANALFFKTIGLANISEFNRVYQSVRDMLAYESEEVFTESDKSWMDYIKKFKSDGYRVHMTNSDGELLIIDACAYVSARNKHLYILELKDVSELEASRQKVAEVEKLKTKFLANIGHEFRTPMNGILGFLELLWQSDLSAKQKEYLEMITNSSKNLMLNIETLLKLSQLQGGRLKVENTPFNPLPLVEKISYEFFHQGRKKGVRVLSFIDPKLPTQIVGDSKKIRQILYAIVQNAVKFTPRTGKVIIEVKLLKRMQNGDCSIGFGVKDTGEGISAEQIARINEPFTAGSHADERLGVGLSLSNSLALLLGSELRIQTKEGEGSYINFVLDFKASKGQNYKMMPKKRAKVLLLDQSRIDEANLLATYLRSFAIDVVKSSELNEMLYEGIEELYIVANPNESAWMLELGTYAKKAPITLVVDEGQKLQTRLTHIVDGILEKPLLASSIAGYLMRGESIQKEQVDDTASKQIDESATVLVVEDNLINQRLIQIMLQEKGIEVVTASNGVEAVEIASQRHFDIIFMDIDLPHKNGIVATKEIKRELPINRSTPIIALTAMAMQGDREMLLREGLDEYIAKPLTHVNLDETLERYLAKKA